MQRNAWQTPGILLIAVIVGYLFSLIGLPIPWLLGPMAAGVVAAIAGGRPIELPKGLQGAALCVLGVSVGLNFSPDALRLLGADLPALMLTIAVTIVLSMVNGWMLSRWAEVDPASGFLGSVPGAASGMVAMSAELGADARVVAVLQYVRMLTVAFLSPAMTEWLFPLSAYPPTESVAPVAQASLLPEPFGVPAVLLVGWLGSIAGRKVGLPAGNFLGAILSTLLLTWTGVTHPTLPTPLFAGALLAIGISVGVQFDIATIRRIRRAAVIEVAQIMGLMAVSLGMGYWLARVTEIDLRTAVLGTVPGAMEAQVALAFSMGVNAPVVVAMHTIRVLILILIGPWIASRLSRSALFQPQKRAE